MSIPKWATHKLEFNYYGKKYLIYSNKEKSVYMEGIPDKRERLWATGVTKSLEDYIEKLSEYGGVKDLKLTKLNLVLENK